MLTVHFNLHAVVHCDTPEEAAALVLALRRAAPDQIRMLEVTEPPPAPTRAVPPAAAPTRKKPGPKPRASAAVAPSPQAEPEPAPPTQPSQRAELEELTRPKKPRDDLLDPGLPRCERKGEKVWGAGTATLAAFSKDQNYPHDQLARHIYGSDAMPAMNNLRHLLEQMTYSAKTLKKVGPKSYAVTVLGAEALKRGLAKLAEQAERTNA